MWHGGSSNISATFPCKSRNSHKKSLYTLPRVGRLPDTKRRAHWGSGSVPHCASVQFQGESYSVAFANSNSWKIDLLTVSPVEDKQSCWALGKATFSGNKVGMSTIERRWRHYECIAWAKAAGNMSGHEWFPPGTLAKVIDYICHWPWGQRLGRVTKAIGS